MRHRRHRRHGAGPNTHWAGKTVLALKLDTVQCRSVGEDNDALVGLGRGEVRRWRIVGTGTPSARGMGCARATRGGRGSRRLGTSCKVRRQEWQLDDPREGRTVA